MSSLYAVGVSTGAQYEYMKQNITPPVLLSEPSAFIQQPRLFFKKKTVPEFSLTCSR